jgi:predicted secreted Zn-dependent protease
VCRMHKDKSWSIPASQSSALLQHEQIHFNIAEHIARRLSAKLNSFHFTANYKNQINEIVRTNSNERDSLQNEYDLQTQHGKNIVMQTKWANHVQKLLKVL